MIIFLAIFKIRDDTVKMLFKFLEQSAFLGALSAIVLAIFWPHIRPIVVPLFQRITSNVVAFIYSAEKLDSDKNNRIRAKPDYIHPKLSGQSFTKKSDQKLGVSFHQLLL